MSKTKGSATPRRLIIGTRGSMLAVAQTRWVADRLRQLHPTLDVVLRKFSTRGDQSQSIDRPLAQVGGKGLFTAELEAALADGEIDLAVHSAKDLPADLADGTDVLCWPEREDPRDALIVGTDSLAPGSLATVPVGATVGCGSLRRIGQLKSLRPDLQIAPIRGNIETRIRKVRQGQFAATVLAVAGLRRADLLAEAAQILQIDQMVPAAGQGALALQGRRGDSRVAELLAALDHGPTRLAVLAERAVVVRLAGGCNMPLGVYVELQPHPSPAPAPPAQPPTPTPAPTLRREGQARLFGRAILVAPSGRPRIEADADAADPTALADQLVTQLLAAGGANLLTPTG